MTCMQQKAEGSRSRTRANEVRNGEFAQAPEQHSPSYHQVCSAWISSGQVVWKHLIQIELPRL